ncbi:hypothetical protein JXA88_03615 [Candidatus Fermentibacteria bacterium]|nr:hypothetical protein [Candidatus Fermentibacteria bacterium]
MTPRKTAKTAEPPAGAAQLEIGVPKVSLRSTKQELLEAYQEVLSRQQEDEPTPRKKAEAEVKRREEIVASARATTVSGIVDSIGRLKLDVSTVLNDLSQKLMAQTERLEEIENAIAAETSRLSRLHDIDIAADTLEDLLRRHNEAETDFTLRIDQRRAEVEEALTTAKAEFEEWVAATREQLEEEMATTREAWERERQLHEQDMKERNERLKREREREAEEYAYGLKLNRQRADNEHAARLAAQEKELAAAREAHQREYADREASLERREAELADLRAQVESFPKQLDKAVTEARAFVKKEAEKEAKTAWDLREREILGEREVARLRIESLEAKVKEQAARVTELNRALDAASTKVQEIAVKAIEGAEGRKALSAVNEIALEQAKRPRDS